MPTGPIRRLALGPYNGGVRERWPVWLVGMMGSGKSTLAPSLADFLGRPWLDSDHEIERRSSCSIAELFETRGEAHFRALERSLIVELESGDAVVALGGGAMVQPGMSERLLKSGTVVYLQAQPEVLLQRVGDADSRPLLRDLDSTERLQRIRALMEERSLVYAQAHVTVATDALEPKDLQSVIAELAGRIERASPRNTGSAE